MTQIQNEDHKDEDPQRYPIGRFAPPSSLTAEQRDRHIQAIQDFPDKVRDVSAQAGPIALEAAYRPDGWTLRQVIHHCADSHMNGYTRFRLALTEDNPSIKLYKQNAWAELADARTGSVEPSLTLLDGLHARWAALLRSLPEDAWPRTYYRSDRDRTVPLFEALAHYAWHCEHHLNHMRMAIANS